MDLDELLEDIINEPAGGAVSQSRPAAQQQPTFTYSDPQPKANPSSGTQAALSSSLNQNNALSMNSQMRASHQQSKQQHHIHSSGLEDEDWDAEDPIPVASNARPAAGNGFNGARAGASVQNQPAQQIYQRNMTTVSDIKDDFDSLLEECAGDARPTQAALQHLNTIQSVTYSDASASQSMPGMKRAGTISGRKCFPLFIGGSALPDGQTNASFQPFCCEALRCSACDKRVVRFSDNVKWADSVDYIFVRNFNTSVNRLREGVVSAPGFSCFACQCQWISTDAPSKRVDEYSHLRWHCRGH